MDGLKDELTRILAAKGNGGGNGRAILSPQGTGALVRLQELAAPILALRGRRVRPSQLDRSPVARGVPYHI